MDAKVNYTVVGIIGISIIVAFIAALIWMSGHRSDEKYQTYVSYFSQDVTGLNPESPVRLNGLKIGHVKSINFVKNNMQQVKIVMRISREITVTTTTYAVLKSAGLTGSEYIALVAKTPTGPALKAKPGESYPVIPTEKSLITTIEDELKGTTAEIKKLVQSVNDLLDENNRKAISQSISNVEKFTNVIADNANNIDRSLSSIQVVLENTANASNQFPSMISQAQATLKSFEAASNQFADIGGKASRTLSQTDATIQNISSQLLPAAQQLLQQLNGMVASLSQVGQELSRNPSVIIRGKTPAPLGPGER